MELLTTVARHSRVKSSMTQKARKQRLSLRVSYEVHRPALIGPLRDRHRQRVRVDDSEEFDPDRLPAPGSAGPAERDPARLSAVLARQSAERREVLLLRFVDDLSLQDIADTLSIPLGTVKSQLHLAVRELRESPEIRDFGKQ